MTATSRSSRRPSRLPLRAAVAASLAAAAVLSTAATAGAASRVLHDSSGDVATVKFAEDEGDGTPTVDPGRLKDDITSVRTTYAGGRITIKAQLRAVRKSGGQAFAEVRTSAGPGRYTIGAAYKNGRKTPDLYSAQADELTCAGMTMRVKRAKGTIAFSLPASCVGSPRWVRTSFATTVVHFPAPAEQAWPESFEDAKYTLDVAGMHGVSKHWLRSSKTRLPLGPVVRQD